MSMLLIRLHAFYVTISLLPEQNLKKMFTEAGAVSEGLENPVLLFSSNRVKLMLRVELETEMAEGNTKAHAGENGNSEMGSKLATVAAVAVGVALIEVELIPGMLIGVAAMLAPRFLPGLGNSLRPLVKAAIRAGYATFEKTKEVVAEASEQFQDVAAEARHEQESAGANVSRKSASKKRPRANAA